MAFWSVYKLTRPKRGGPVRREFLGRVRSYDSLDAFERAQQKFNVTHTKNHLGPLRTGEVWVNVRPWRTDPQRDTLTRLGYMIDGKFDGKDS